MATNIPGITNFQDAVTMEETLVVTGAVQGASFSGAMAPTTLTASGLTKTPNPVFQQTISNIGTQAATPTIAQILGGIITHTVITGTSTATMPTGTAMSTGVSGVAVGSTIKWLFRNTSASAYDSVITAAADHTIVGGTATVTQGKYVLCTSVCTAANTWVTYLTTLM